LGGRSTPPPLEKKGGAGKRGDERIQIYKYIYTYIFDKNLFESDLQKKKKKEEERKKRGGFV